MADIHYTNVRIFDGGGEAPFMRHPIGAFVGAIVYVLLQNFAIDLFVRERFNLVIGGVFLAIVLFSPDGLLGLWAIVRSRLLQPELSNQKRRQL